MEQPLLVSIWSLFGRYLVAIWSLFGRYLVAIWSRFGRYLSLLVAIWSLLFATRLFGHYLVAILCFWAEFFDIYSLHGDPCKYGACDILGYITAPVRGQE